MGVAGVAGVASVACVAGVAAAGCLRRRTICQSVAVITKRSSKSDQSSTTPGRPPSAHQVAKRGPHAKPHQCQLLGAVNPPMTEVFWYDMALRFKTVRYLVGSLIVNSIAVNPICIRVTAVGLVFV